jgi:hypothetical protein
MHSYTSLNHNLPNIFGQVSQFYVGSSGVLAVNNKNFQQQKVSQRISS